FAPRKQRHFRGAKGDDTTRTFSRSAGLLGKLVPVRKSFDFNPLAILAQAELTRGAKNGKGAYPAM
ncbi:MAG: hypothetical protein ACLQNE_31130, partial [Thermoguttaceae bacterium]